MVKLFSDPIIAALILSGLLGTWFLFVWLVGKFLEWLQLDIDLDFKGDDEDDDWWKNF